MKSFRRIVRRREEAAKRATRPRSRTADVFPIMNRTRQDLPCEIIDLSADRPWYTVVRGNRQAPGRNNRKDG